MSAHLEHAVIGAILSAEHGLMKSNAQALMHQAGLKTSNFTDAKARATWGVIERIAAANRPINAVSVFRFGSTMKTFSEADFTWLQTLENEAMLDRSRFTEIVDAMRSKERAQWFRVALQEASQLMESPGCDLLQVIERLEDAIAATVLTMDDYDTSTGDMDLAEVGDDWERSEAGEQVDLIPTGIEPLDKLIGGFLLNLNLIIGAPSEGKSAVIATLIKLLLLAGHKVGLFGLEDGTKWLQRRHVGVGMGIPLRDVGRKPRDHAAQVKWAEVTAALAPVMRNLYTSKKTAQTPKQVLRQAAKWKAKGVRINFIDHGGELDHASDKVDEHRLRVGLSYKMIRDWAVAEQVAMVVVAPTRRKDDRDVEPRPPRIDEVRDSSDLDFAARVCLSIWSVPGEDFVRITSAKVTEGVRYKTVRCPKLGGGTLIDHEGAEEIDLFAERMKAARLKKEQKEADRLAAKALRDAEKEAAKAAKAAKSAKATAQGGLGLGQ